MYSQINEIIQVHVHVCTLVLFVTDTFYLVCPFLCLLIIVRSIVRVNYFMTSCVLDYSDTIELNCIVLSNVFVNRLYVERK